MSRAVDIPVRRSEELELSPLSTIDDDDDGAVGESMESTGGGAFPRKYAAGATDDPDEESWDGRVHEGDLSASQRERRKQQGHREQQLFDGKAARPDSGRPAKPAQKYPTGLAMMGTSSAGDEQMTHSRDMEKLGAGGFVPSEGHFHTGKHAHDEAHLARKYPRWLRSVISLGLLLTLVLLVTHWGQLLIAVGLSESGDDQLDDTSAIVKREEVAGEDDKLTGHCFIGGKPGRCFDGWSIAHDFSRDRDKDSQYAPYAENTIKLAHDVKVQGERFAMQLSSDVVTNPTLLTTQPRGVFCQSQDADDVNIEEGVACRFRLAGYDTHNANITGVPVRTSHEAEENVESWNDLRAKPVKDPTEGVLPRFFNAFKEIDEFGKITNTRPLDWVFAIAFAISVTTILQIFTMGARILHPHWRWLPHPNVIRLSQLINVLLLVDALVMICAGFALSAMIWDKGTSPYGDKEFTNPTVLTLIALGVCLLVTTAVAKSRKVLAHHKDKSPAAQKMHSALEKIKEARKQLDYVKKEVHDPSLREHGDAHKEVTFVLHASELYVLCLAVFLVVTLTAVSFNGLHQKHTTDCCFHCTTSHCSPSSFKCYAFTAADVKDATVKDYYSKCEPMSGPTLKDWQDGPSSKQMRRPGWMTANTGATGVAGTANVWSGAGFSPDESRGWFRNTTYAIVLDTPLQVHGGVVVELDHAILAHRIANPLDASWNAWDSVYSAPWESSEAKMPRTRRGGLLRVFASGLVVAKNVLFDGGHAFTGGAVAVDEGGVFICDDCIFVRSAAIDSGGAVHNFEGAVWLERTIWGDRIAQAVKRAEREGQGEAVAGLQNVAGLSCRTTGVNTSAGLNKGQPTQCGVHSEPEYWGADCFCQKAQPLAKGSAMFSTVERLMCPGRTVVPATGKLSPCPRAEAMSVATQDGCQGCRCEKHGEAGLDTTTHYCPGLRAGDECHVYLPATVGTAGYRDAPGQCHKKFKEPSR